MASLVSRNRDAVGNGSAEIMTAAIYGPQRVTAANGGLDLDAAATGIPAKFYGENSIAISANNVDCRSASVNAI